ncbi:MAG: amino acid adenylation domain-containing protein [Acidimicrobiia bacterium]
MTTLQNVEDAYPLTATQEGMVFHTLSDPDSGVYVNQILTPIAGAFDVGRFEQAWDGAVSRHSALRTAFLWDGLDDPLQVVRSQVTTDWNHIDLRSFSSTEQQSRIDEFLAFDRDQGFDLAEAPLCRMAVIRTGTAEWLWVWSFHHVIADGWSAGRVLDEVFAEYGGVEQAAGSSSAYRDFIAAYLDRDQSREEAFWRDRLSGLPETQNLSIPGLPPDSQGSGHTTHAFAFDLEMSTQFADLARSMNVTLNTAFVGVWALMVASWTRSTDILFGATVAGRSAATPGIDEAVGLFINTLPLRIPVSPRAELGPWLRDVQRAQIETREFEQSSLASVQRWSEAVDGGPLFDNILVFENYPRVEMGARFGEIEIGTRTYIEQSNYPLAVLVLPGDPIRISLVYDTSVFPAEAMVSLEGQMRTLMASMIETPDSHLGGLVLTPDDDRAWLRSVGTGTSLPEVTKTIDEVIRVAAQASPDAIAVVDAAAELSYADLVREAELVAQRLADAGVGRGDLVGLHLPRSAQMIVGLLGILTAGAAYVPLDPDYPQQHLNDLLASEGIRTVLTSAGLATALPDSVSTLLIGAPSDPRSESASLPPPALAPTDLAYVIHTSGSSGRPKGVGVTHANLVQSTRAREVYYDEPVDTFMLLSSFAFDSSVAGIFWTLTTGGTLVLPNSGLERDIDATLDLMQTRRVTHTLCLPSLYEILLEHARPGQLSSLNVAIVAGEACPPRIVDLHRDALAHAELHNEYGPTEATVWCAVHTADEHSDPVPIGRPIAGSRLYVLDAFGNPVPPGFAGEICVAGDGVVEGYLERPDLTAEKFVSTHVLGTQERIYRTGDLGAWRPDGSLLYLGRTDAQLKIRGHRIEPASVEAALRAHPGVSDAVAVGRSLAGNQAKQLVAYVATQGPKGLGEELKRELAGTMPDFMVPDVVIELDALPRLPNGKIDAASLPDPVKRTEAIGRRVPPRNDEERILATIWAELLGLEEVGVNEDFFELGGDSIVSIRMISRARQQGINLQPSLIVAHPTVEQLVANSNSSVVTASSDQGPGEVLLGPIQRWFFEMERPEPDHWNMSNLYALDLAVDPDHLRTALEACVAHHAMLRARFTRQPGLWSQSVDGDATVSLELFSADDDLDEVTQALQSGLSLEHGPLLRVALIERHEQEPDLLFVAVHHLVMDAVSWTILIDDLDVAYRQAASGAAVNLPSPTTSYRDWVTYLGTDAVRPDLDYWLDRLDHRVDDSQKWGTEGDTESVTVYLDRDATEQLLTRANRAYRTTPEELLIAALGSVLDQQPNGQVRLALERHGRLSDVPGIDLSRTIGWFTAQFPVILNGEASSAGEAITDAKEMVRGIPADGVGYGALRYVREEKDLVNDGEPDYVFNYLSRASGAESGTFRQLSTCDETSRHSTSPRAHRFEIVAAIVDGSVRIEWQFSGTHDDPVVVQGLADSYLERLREVIEHCVSGGTGSFTPSDFPAAGLDQADLDSLLEEL